MTFLAEWWRKGGKFYTALACAALIAFIVSTVLAVCSASPHPAYGFAAGLSMLFLVGIGLWQFFFAKRPLHKAFFKQRAVSVSASPRASPRRR